MIKNIKSVGITLRNIKLLDKAPHKEWGRVTNTAQGEAEYYI